MLDALSISTPSGLVLWSKNYSSHTASASAGGGGPLNSLVQEVLLNNERNTSGSSNRHDKDAQSCMWTLANDLGLIFVVVWPRILHLTYLDKLLETIKSLFISMFGDTVRAINAGELLEVPGYDWSKLWKGWDAIVARLVRELEAEATKGSRSGIKTARNGAMRPPMESEASSNGPSTPDEDSTTPTVSPLKGTVADAETIAKNIAALKARNKARLSPSPRGLKKGKGGASSASEASESVELVDMQPSNALTVFAVAKERPSGQ